MSQRATYPHGSPSLPAVRGLEPIPDADLQADGSLSRPVPRRRPSQQENGQPIAPRTLVGQRRASEKGLAGQNSASKGTEAAGRTTPSLSHPWRLTAILGRRRRWQRYLLFLFGLIAVYLLIRPRQSKTATPGDSRPSGQSRRKTRPLHVRTSSPSRAPVPASVVLQSRSEHEVKDGLLEVDMTSKVHPLYQLIRDAREDWDEKVARQSTTLKGAVAEYKKRNQGRSPPKGFDKWWAYVVENNVPLPDEYDQVNRDLRPFRALSPRQLQKRIETTSRLPDTYTIRVKSGSIRTSVTFNNDVEIQGARMRVDGQVELLRSIAKDIPDFTAVYTVHDTAAGSISWEHRAELEDHVQDGEYLDDGEELDITHRGWAFACPSHSKIRRYDSGLYDTPPPSHSFISDHRAAMDLCAHPDQIPQHGLLAGKNPHHLDLTPLFCLSKTNLHSDILGVPTEQWSGDVPYIPWEDKNKEKLLWRGSNTGSLFSTQTPWRESHRVRLVQLATETEGGKTMLPLPKKANGRGSLPTLGDGVWEMEKSVGNDKYLDIHFTGSAIQCDVEDRTCAELGRMFDFIDRMTHDDALHYKYVLDVDGNAWSARFQRLLASGSLIFKTTITPEWWTDRIQPWVHYVPIKLDYSDLHDAFAFFQGGLDGQHGEPLLAKQIASEGKEWVDTYWREEDMTAYVFRLYLEWARLLAPSKQGADFVYDESMEISRA